MLEVLGSYRQHFADRDLLAAVVLERMLAGVLTAGIAARANRSASNPRSGRGRRRSLRSHGRSVARTREALGVLMSRQLGDVRLAVIILDGLELKGG